MAQPANGPAAGAITGATITGKVLGGAGTTSLGPASSLRPLSVGLTVTIVGTSMTASVDGAGGFFFHDVPDGDDVLEFRGPGIDARMPLAGVTDHEDIHLTVMVNGATADIDANERHTPDNRVELEGRIASVNAGAHTITIGTTVVSVPDGAIQHDGNTLAFSALVVGERVHVHATMVGGTVTANKIDVDGDNQGPPAAPVNPVPEPGDDRGNDNDNNELNGTLAAKGGACPTITFTVSSTSVATNASTEFKDTACSALKNGDSVEVKGARQTNGTLLASRVEKKK